MLFMKAASFYFFTRKQYFVRTQPNNNFPLPVLSQYELFMRQVKFLTQVLILWSSNREAPPWYTLPTPYDCCFTGRSGRYLCEKAHRPYTRNLFASFVYILQTLNATCQVSLVDSMFRMWGSLVCCKRRDRERERERERAREKESKMK